LDNSILHSGKIIDIALRFLTRKWTCAGVADFFRLNWCIRNNELFRIPANFYEIEGGRSAKTATFLITGLSA